MALGDGCPLAGVKTRSRVRPDSDHRAQGPLCVHCQQLLRLPTARRVLAEPLAVPVTR